MARLGWWPGKEFALSVQTEIGDIRGKGLEWCYLSGVAWPPFPRNEKTQILLDGNWPRSSRKFEEIAFGWGSSVLHNATRYVGAHGQATITPMAKDAVDHTIMLNIGIWCRINTLLIELTRPTAAFLHFDVRISAEGRLLMTYSGHKTISTDSIGFPRDGFPHESEWYVYNQLWISSISFPPLWSCI